MIVNFAILDDHVASCGINHRLSAGGRRIDNRQARAAEPAAAIGRSPFAGGIGAAMAQASEIERGSGAGGAEMNGDAAHDPLGSSAEAAVDLKVPGDHFFARKSLRVSEAFLTPVDALGRIDQQQQIAGETFLVFDSMIEASVACDLGQGGRVSANDRTT